eukprot:3881533-Alexandrium_andersonii.AAC.1
MLSHIDVGALALQSDAQTRPTRALSASVRRPLGCSFVCACGRGPVRQRTVSPGDRFARGPVRQGPFRQGT